MSLSNVPVQIINLSVGQLRKLADQQGLTAVPGTTKVGLIRLLDESVEPAALEAAAADYLYAGSTSVAWVQFTDGPIAHADLKRALTTMCGADPFGNPLSPALDSTPRLLSARAWLHGKVILTFGVRGSERVVIQGGQLTEVSDDSLFQGVFRLSDGVLEIRSSNVHVQKLRDFVQVLAQELGRNAAQLPITAADFDAVRTALGASLTDYTGSDTSPSPFRTRSVTKKPTCADLAVEPAFQQEYGGLDVVKGDIVFLDGAAEEVTALVSIGSSSVYFRTTATETTIDTVYEVLRGTWP